VAVAVAVVVAVAMAMATVVMVAVAVTSRRWLQTSLLGEFGRNIPKWNNSIFYNLENTEYSKME
jgi:hypothetical protein